MFDMRGANADSLSGFIISCVQSDIGLVATREELLESSEQQHEQQQ